MLRGTSRNPETIVEHRSKAVTIPNEDLGGKLPDGHWRMRSHLSNESTLFFEQGAVLR
jgi:hypothetical protein